MQSLICQPTYSEDDNIKLSPIELIALSKQYDTFLYLWHKDVMGVDELFTVLYIEPNGKGAVMGWVDDTRTFIPTTCNMTSSKCRRGWHLTGRNHRNGNIEEIRYHYEDFSYVNRDSELKLDLWVGKPEQGRLINF